MLLNWERIAFRTVYTDAATPVPVGVPVLGFTSLAMHRAVQASLSRNRPSSERVVVVAAAYQVLKRYYPALSGSFGPTAPRAWRPWARARPSASASRSGSVPGVAS